MSRFACLSEARHDAPETWKDKRFITLDIDWAHDEVLADSIDLIEKAGVKATWFVTHDTPLLARLRVNSKFELGIHPNFNPLLQGSGEKGANLEEVIERMLALVPGAKSARSHSVAQSARICKAMADRGITHDSNDFVGEWSGMHLKPWRMIDGLIKMPYFFSDEVSCLAGSRALMAELAAREGLKVFDFHPIHVFLNTENIARYETARPDFHAPERLAAHRGDAAHGTRALLQSLLEAG